MVDDIDVRHSKELKQKVKIVFRFLSWQKHLLVEELGDDAANAPHVDCCVVVCTIIQRQFRRSIIPRCDILRKLVFLVDKIVLNIRLAEVGDLDVPIIIY